MASSPGTSQTAGADRAQAALRGRYDLVRELGSGGMATVYLARDVRHRRAVAVKVLHPAVAAAIGPERFLREIEIAAGLVHPHILGLFDSGDADGLLYYVMPFVDGPSLRDRLRLERELPVDDTIAILRDLVEALAWAHGRGIVHRDLKPENVLLAGSHAQLADFGIAKAVHAASTATLTATGVVVGTPAYMAPEQAVGDPEVDHRADLYAVGVLAYEMLTGTTPFAGATPQQLMAAHLTRRVEPLATVRPSTPAGLAAAVMRCLEKRPADRWQSAGELLRHLRLDEPPARATAYAGTAATIDTFPITEDLCRRLDRSTFDPRMIGDRMSYVDSRVSSDVLVILVNRWGLDTPDNPAIAEAIPFRTILPTLFGFDAGRKVRFAMSVPDHLVLLEALIGALTSRIQPRLVVVAGFSAGGDLMLRLAAEAPATTRIDGCLALGPNLGLETCNVTGVIADVSNSAPESVLPALNQALAGASTVNDWLNLADYLIQIVGNFRDDLTPVRAFAQGIVEPWRTEGTDAFVRWFRAATGAGRRVRSVFEDNDAYRHLVRKLQLRNLDDGALGQAYRPGSIVVEPVAGHFDLVEPERVARHLQALVAELRTA